MRRRYDERAAANRRWEWAHWAAERRAIDAEWAREARLERLREQYTQFCMTHGGWRHIPPSPQPSPHRGLIGSIVHGVGDGLGHAWNWIDHHKMQTITVTAIVALTVVNVAQLGLDPVTDGAEAGAIGEEGALIAADDEVPEVTLDSSRYPESAAHARDAMGSDSAEYTIDRAGAASRRAASLRGHARISGFDRDEWPPAMFEEGGEGSSVRPSDPSDNRGAGSSIGNQCRPYANGTVVRITILLMVDSSIQALISVASPALATNDVPEHRERVPSTLGLLLALRNGFYAFESALHVFGDGGPNTVGRSLSEWNSGTGWQRNYDRKFADLTFFAEDIFGVQFAIRDDAVLLFDPETGSMESFAESVEAWATTILSDYEMVTGYPIAHEWQSVNGPLAPSMRLVPIRPFVLGGEFSPTNVVAMDAVKGMKARADLAAQINGLPEGVKVTYRIE